MQNISLGLFVIRVGLAGVLLWFGAHEIMSPADWIGYVPAWASAIADAHTIVILNGSVEIMSGLLVLFGFFVRIASLAMGAHLILIAFSLGYNSTAVRDLGLAFAFFGLALAGGGSITLQSFFEARSRSPSPREPQ